MLLRTIFFSLLLISLSFSVNSFAQENLESAETIEPVADAGTILNIEEIEVQDINSDIAKVEYNNNALKQDQNKKENMYIDISVADVIGIYDKYNGGVDLDYWKNRSYNDILNILKGIKINTKSYAYNSALRRIILSKVNIPKPDSKEDIGKIAKVKIDLLINAGRFDDAKQMIEIMPADVRNKLFVKKLVKMGLVDFDNRLVCETLSEQSQEVLNSPFWQATKLVCLTIAYDGSDAKKEEINKKINEIEVSNIQIPTGLKELVLYYVFDEEITVNQEIDVNPWSLNIMRLIGFGTYIGDDIDDIYVKRGLLLNKEIDSYKRLKIAEELFINDAIDNNKLYTIYNSLSRDFNVEKIVDDETGNEYYPKTYQRYLYYKSLMILNGKNKVNEVLNIVSSAESYSEKINAVRMFSPMLENVIPFKGEKGAKVAKLFYSIGDIKNGNKWMKKNKNALWFERAVLEPINPTEHPIVFDQKYGVFNDFETSIEIEKSDKGIFSSIFSNKEPAKNNVKRIKKVNHNPLAENSKQRIVWMNYQKNQEPKQRLRNNEKISGLKMSSAFSMLESIGYKISDASWLFASQNSSYQEVRVLDPAKSKALQIYIKNARDPIHILMITQQFVNQVEVNDTEFAKIINALYRADFIAIIRELILERSVIYL